MRKGELGYALTTFCAAAQHLRALGRAESPRAVPIPARRSKARTPGIAVHVRNASAPSMLELVALEANGQTGAAVADADLGDGAPIWATSATGTSWTSRFGRWRLPPMPPRSAAAVLAGAPREDAAAVVTQ